MRCTRATRTRATWSTPPSPGRTRTPSRRASRRWRPTRRRPGSPVGEQRVGRAVPADRPQGRGPHLRGRDPGQLAVRQGRRRLHHEGRAPAGPAAPDADRVLEDHPGEDRHRRRRGDPGPDLGRFQASTSPGRSACWSTTPRRRWNPGRADCRSAGGRRGAADRGCPATGRSPRSATRSPRSGSRSGCWTTPSTRCQRAATRRPRRTWSARSAAGRCGGRHGRQYGDRLDACGAFRGEPVPAGLTGGTGGTRRGAGPLPDPGPPYRLRRQRRRLPDRGSGRGAGEWPGEAVP